MIFKDLKIVGYWNSKWLETNVHSKSSAELDVKFAHAIQYYAAHE